MKRLIAIIAVSIAQLSNAQEADSIQNSISQLQQSLTEVTFNATASKIREQVGMTQMGKVDLPISMLSKVPTIAGEPDVIKALQLTPGVKRGPEGSIGTYVRGGGKDENLVLMDGAPVYNAGHMLGFFSVFNTNALKDVNMYKSCFPAQYGGRLSSIMDITTKDGSMQSFKGSGSIGLISSNLTLQGPIIKDKLSAIISARRTYVDKILTYIPYHFYDVNAKVVYKIDERNRLYLSTYKGDDVMDMVRSGTDSAKGDYTISSAMKLGNNVASLRWNNRPQHGRFISDITTYYSGFQYKVAGKMGGNVLSMNSAIRDMGLKGEWKWRETGSHKINSGLSYASHYFNPNIVHSKGAALEQFKSSEGRKIYTHEIAAYVQDDFSIIENWQLNAGVRLSAAIVKDKVYANPEPRLGMRYQVNEESSIKASYARMAQYMQLVSSSSLSLPTDLWYPVTATIKPGISDQVSAGYYYAFPDLGISLSSEIYYKWMKNLVEYKEGAVLIMNDEYEKELFSGEGEAYGLELFASKTTGRLTGWIGYSLSYAKRRFDSLNNGQQYYARYDRRHDISVVGMYRLSKRWGVNAVVQYATGAPFTGQQSQYVVPKPDFTGFDVLPVYTSRNELRMSAAFRIDFDLEYKFNIGKRIHGDTHLGVYNMLNRTQPYAVQRVYDETKKAYKYEQKGLFGAIPSISVNFNF